MVYEPECQNPVLVRLEAIAERVLAYSTLRGRSVDDLRRLPLESIRTMVETRTGRPMRTGDGLLSREQVDAALDEALRPYH